MANDIGRFKGPLGSSGYWELPNRGYEWDVGLSLGPYRTGDEHTITPLGQRIRDYKYWNVPASELESLARDITQKALEVLWERFESPAFRYLIAVPPNHKGKPSLPRHVCQSIAERYPALFEDKSNSITTLRELDSVKGVYKGSRAEYVKGAWGINPKAFPKPTKGSGVLIVDDVYDTGSTMREMSRTLRREFKRDVAQHVLTLSHVETRDWNQP
jgi:predicted amidophosphoribosyltransferase